ncbi:MAG: tail fiber protein [Bacteroidota bacterium]
MNPLIGQILMFGGNFAPRGWALCDGQLLAISQNTALFSILGTTYGGDGRTTFALPDLRGRLALHTGTGPGLTPRPLGQRYGTEYNVLNVTQLANHNHTAVVGGNVKIPVSANAADQTTAEENYMAETTGGTEIYHENPTSGQIYGSTINQVTVALQNSGNNQSVNNMMPYEVINYIIALVGIFPSRS